MDPIDAARVDRLRDALGNSGMSQAEFLRRFKPLADSEGITGASYHTLWRYLSPEHDTAPTVPWLRLAARVLHVAPEWLTDDRGPRDLFEDIVAPDWLDEHVARVEGMRRGAPYILGGDELTQAPFLLALRRLITTLEDDEVDPEGYHDLARMLESFIIWPIVVLNPQDRAPQSYQGQRWIDYLEAMSHALKLAMPPPGEGRTVTEIAVEVDPKDVEVLRTRLMAMVSLPGHADE